MGKIITQPKTKTLVGRTPKEILQIWEKARGIWKKKKPGPITYLRKMRKEWKRKIP
ncbi:MAG: hypothetical protein QME61_00405 [Patescibacteria group bacterium]|nr:hypothetical protein [Patescibacteria group bacterium]